MAPDSRTIVAKRGRPFSAIDRPMNRERDLLESATRSMTPRRATTRPNRTGSRLRSCDGYGCFHSHPNDAYPPNGGPHRRLPSWDFRDGLPASSEPSPQSFFNGGMRAVPPTGDGLRTATTQRVKRRPTHRDRWKSTTAPIATTASDLPGSPRSRGRPHVGSCRQRRIV